MAKAKDKTIERITFYVDGIQYDVKAKKGETVAQLIIRADKKKKEIESGILKVGKDMTVKKWTDEWLEIYKRPAGIFLKFMLYCGIRTAEAAALQWRHVGLKNNRLKIDQAPKKSGAI